VRVSRSVVFVMIVSNNHSSWEAGRFDARDAQRNQSLSLGFKSDCVSEFFDA
jgi:hypothetical protein